ncbi:response regulator transcription factor [Paenibacillus agricola]|uniref:Response regulator n=1 Tax=Paenibacillus agricola TaxID=2716264 RepID=A0ABX0J8D3_9BACL|nr:response regulator [Paenibacillus agricola]NHN31863.1 response regulator [Paenibacillus agricola]
MKKYRCLIVDDEDLIIRSLEQFFESHTGRYELVGKAYSGQEAASLAMKLKPDIILTDIVMPGMNGIDMIELLKDQLPRTVFIILTAYSDFEYAKRAIRMNVKDYILKVPLSEADIFGTLDRTSQTIYEIEAKENELSKLHTSRLEHMYRFRSQIMSALLQGSIQPQQIPRYCDELKVNPVLPDYCCFVIQFDDYALFQKRYGQADQNIIRYGMLNVAEETLSAKAAGFVCEIKDHQMVGFVAWPSMDNAAEVHRCCIELGNELIVNIQKYMNQIIHVGFSRSHHGWETVVEAFGQASELLGDVYYLGGEGHTYAKLPFSSIQPGDVGMMKEWLQEITNKLLPETKLEELKGKLSRIAHYAEEHRIPQAQMSALIRQFMEDVKQKIVVWKLVADPMPYVLDDTIKFEEQWKRVLAYIEDCLSQRHAPVRTEISKAKQYIEMHIAERLTLDDVADYVNLVPSYFSTLFKKVENENFVDYVNRRKIEKALALLKEKDYSNLQLSKLVGIHNERYFCTLFKQLYGLPPQKFRKTYL